MSPVQRFSDEYLASCKDVSADQVIRFLEDYRRVHLAEPKASKLISMKVPTDLLDAFRLKAELTGTRYQTQIKELMRAWLRAPLE